MKCKTDRAGYTLINTIVVIGLLSILLAAVALALHGMYRLDESVRGDFDVLRSGSRLSMILRQDAHVAESVEVQSGKNATLTLHLSQNVDVAYTMTETSIERTKRENDEVVHRDAFSFGDDLVVDVSVEQTDRTSMVTLNATRPSDVDSTLSAKPLLSIECAVGLTHRFKKTPADGESR